MKTGADAYKEVQDMNIVDVLSELKYLRQYVDFGCRFLTERGNLSPSECQNALNRWDRIVSSVEKMV